MSNNHAVWPDLVFASLLILAGLMMLKYGLWHLVNHHEVLSPLFAGCGAVVLGALSIRQVLRSRSPRRNRFKRRLSSSRSQWWFWVIMISVDGSGIGSAQVAMDIPAGGETAASRAQGLGSIVAVQRLPRKYDLSRVGNRGIGGGFNLHSMEKEQQLGSKLSAEIDRRARSFDEPMTIQYLNHLCQTLSRQSDSHFPLTVKIIEGDEPNIFALPGGFLYVTTGLFAVADNEGELAGLISHEIAHIAARHATKGASRRRLWSFVSRPAMFLGPFGVLAWQFGGIAVPAKLNRNAELEADLLGLQYMYLAGYDPGEFLRFLDRAYVFEDRNPSRLALVFSDYPSPKERLRTDQHVLSTLPPRAEYMVDTSAFADVKAKFAPLEPELRRSGKDSNGPRLRRRTQQEQYSGSQE